MTTTGESITTEEITSTEKAVNHLFDQQFTRQQLNSFSANNKSINNTYDVKMSEFNDDSFYCLMRLDIL